MSEPEFEVVDALYFIKPFDELRNELQLSASELKDILHDLFRKGWVCCYSDPVSEIPDRDVHIETDYRKYHYLATKAGLLAHTSGE
jgi:hypothetical protein